MLDVKFLIHNNYENLGKFFTWVFNSHSGYGDENKRFLNKLISPKPSTSGLQVEAKTENAELDKIVEDSYSVTNVKVLNIHINEQQDMTFHLKLFRHAGYPGGESDREMGECSAQMDIFCFSILMSKYYMEKSSCNCNTKNY